MNNFDMLNLEGIDGSGKTTICKSLHMLLQSAGYNVITLDFPAYDLPTGDIIGKYLVGEFGKASTLDPFRAAQFYIDNRVEWYTLNNPWKQTTENGAYVLLGNRSHLSNLYHQVSKLCASRANETWDFEAFMPQLKRYCDAVYQDEFIKTGIASNISTIYNVYIYHENFSTNLKLLNGRSGEKDEHEKSHSYLKHCNDFAVNLANSSEFTDLVYHDKYHWWGYKPLSCSDEERNLKTPYDIATEIFQLFNLHRLAQSNKILL